MLAETFTGVHFIIFTVTFQKQGRPFSNIISPDFSCQNPSNNRPSQAHELSIYNVICACFVSVCVWVGLMTSLLYAPKDSRRTQYPSKCSKCKPKRLKSKFPYEKYPPRPKPYMEPPQSPPERNIARMSRVYFREFTREHEHLERKM